MDDPGTTHSPLEQFLRQYADATGGAWEEIEPQVYDLMLPPGSAAGGSALDAEIVRVAFDAEAIPEHPGSQLASFGTPLVNRLLADAIARGQATRLYMVGLNLAPQGLAVAARRALALPEGTELRLARVRPLHFPQAVFWFEATFASDQKEQELVPVAIDLHYGRQVRHLDRLVDRSHLAEEPWMALPEARHAGLAAAYPSARERVVRTVAALANTRARELAERLDRQVERMSRYYSDLRAEMDEQAQRARNRDEDPTKFTQRREALEREERLRICELHQKNTLRVQLRLVSVLVIYQPKIELRALAHPGGGLPPSDLELVWDPLLEALEAVACPDCGQPTFHFAAPRPGRFTCPACTAAAAKRVRK